MKKLADAAIVAALLWISSPDWAVPVPTDPPAAVTHSAQELHGDRPC